MRTNLANEGAGPRHGEVHIGGEGQLWVWTDQGQRTIASSGPEATHFAKSHGWPDHLVSVVQSLGSKIR